MIASNHRTFLSFGSEHCLMTAALGADFSLTEVEILLQATWGFFNAQVRILPPFHVSGHVS